MMHATPHPTHESFPDAPAIKTELQRFRVMEKEVTKKADTKMRGKWLKSLFCNIELTCTIYINRILEQGQDLARERRETYYEGARDRCCLLTALPSLSDYYLFHSSTSFLLSPSAYLLCSRIFL